MSYTTFMFKHITNYFDKMEDHIRIFLSHRPITYSLIGAVGIILLWKGVWETAELFPLLHGPGSIIVGIILLLATGLLVSFFIGDNIILSGHKREKKLAERTESEVLKTAETTGVIIEKLDSLEQHVQELEKQSRPPKSSGF